MPQSISRRPLHDRGRLKVVIVIPLVLASAVGAGAVAGFWSASAGGTSAVVLGVLAVLPILAVLLYRGTIEPYYRRLEDANLELRLNQEELNDIRDDLFIKFLGISDVNHAVNSPHLIEKRLHDVAEITARVMGADACLVYLYYKKKDDLVLAATWGGHEESVGAVRVALGQGIAGWAARKIEPVMLRDFRSDARFSEIPGLSVADYLSLYSLPLYVYSSGTLMGVIELYYEKGKHFTDEDITFFTTLSGIISTTIQNDRLQEELAKMNTELEQWVAEKTEELRASEERYRTLVENACESILVLTESGDIVFANEQAARLTGYAKYDLLQKRIFDLFSDPAEVRALLDDARQGQRVLRQGELKMSGGAAVPVDVSAVGLTLMGKRFVQSVIRDMSSRAQLESLLQKKDLEIASLKGQQEH